MATLVEDHVSVSVTLVQNGDGTKVALATGTSFTASGATLRTYPETNVTALLSPTDQQKAIDVLAAVVALLKSTWSIP